MQVALARKYKDSEEREGGGAKVVEVYGRFKVADFACLRKSPYVRVLDIYVWSGAVSSRDLVCT